MALQNLRILIVDDTALYRKILRDVLESMPGTEVVATAPNGKIALTKIDQFEPDLVTLDVEMPEMDGLETLRNLKSKPSKPAIIMVSSLTQRDAEVTLQALQLGAFDFIAKPSGGSIVQNVNALKDQFTPKIETLRKRLRPVGIHKQVPQISGTKPSIPIKETISAPRIPIHKPQVVALGISTGGPKALAEIIPQLPGDFPIPMVLVQHMPPVFTKALADSLNRKSAVTVVEGENGMPLQPGHVYIAPGGKQMKIVANGQTNVIKITDDPPENHCKPSVDYLFRSVNAIYGAKTLAVIMTGMGRDGTQSLHQMKQSGAYVIAQNEATSVVFGMPMEAIKAGVVDEILPLDQIAGKIIKLARGF